MILSDYMEQLEEPTRTITVYAPPPRPDLVDWIATETTIESVNYRSLPETTATSQSFLVIHENDEFCAAISLEAAQEFRTPPIYDPWDDALEDASYQRVIDIFSTTVWNDLDRRQLLATSREIESRAWRVGNGTLRVGFQRAAALEAMVSVYTRLAAETALDIHIYIDDSWDQPSVPGVTIHTDAGDEIGSFWTLVFDGNGDKLWTSGLLARELDSGAFEGVWIDDTQLVATLEHAILESAETS